MSIKLGIAGLGAIGQEVMNAVLEQRVQGFSLAGISERNEQDAPVPSMSFENLAETCDLIVEALPPSQVPALAEPVLAAHKDLIIISSSALLLYPEILEWHKKSKGRIIVPSGALIGLDGVNSLINMRYKNPIERVKIVSMKPPMGFQGAPYIVENAIDLSAITEKTRLFSGNAFEAAKGFPANVNVAATLSLAALGPEKMEVEIWADPQAQGNSHEIRVESAMSSMSARVENKPSPQNPKTSVLAAQSIISVLRGMTDPLVVL